METCLFSCLYFIFLTEDSIFLYILHNSYIKCYVMCLLKKKKKERKDIMGCLPSSAQHIVNLSQVDRMYQGPFVLFCSGSASVQLSL